MLLEDSLLSLLLGGASGAGATASVFAALFALGIVKRLIAIGCGSGRGTCCGLVCPCESERARSTTTRRCSPTRSVPSPIECTARLLVEWVVEIIMFGVVTLVMPFSLGGAAAASSGNARMAATSELLFLGNLRAICFGLICVVPFLLALATDESEESVVVRRSDEPGTPAVDDSDDGTTTPSGTPQRPHRYERRSRSGSGSDDSISDVVDDRAVASILGGFAPPSPSIDALISTSVFRDAPSTPPTRRRRRCGSEAAEHTRDDSEDLKATAQQLTVPLGARERARRRVFRALTFAVCVTLAGFVAAMCSVILSLMIVDATQRNPLGGAAGPLAVVLQYRDWVGAARPSQWGLALRGRLVTKAAADAAVIATPLNEVCLAAVISVILPIALLSFVVYTATGLVALPLVLLPPAPRCGSRRSAPEDGVHVKRQKNAPPVNSSDNDDVASASTSSPKMRHIVQRAAAARESMTTLQDEERDLLSATSWRGMRPSATQRERASQLAADIARTANVLDAIERESRAVDDDEEEWRALIRSGDLCALSCFADASRYAASLCPERVPAGHSSYGAGRGEGQGSTSYAYEDASEHDDDPWKRYSLPGGTGRGGGEEEERHRVRDADLASISSMAWVCRAGSGSMAVGVAGLLFASALGAGIERILRPHNFGRGSSGFLPHNMLSAEGSDHLAIFLIRPLDVALLFAKEHGGVDGLLIVLVACVVAIATAIGTRRLKLLSPTGGGVYSLTEELRRRRLRIRRAEELRSRARAAYSFPEHSVLSESDEECAGADRARSGNEGDAEDFAPATTPLRGDLGSLLALLHVLLAQFAFSIALPVLAPQYSFFGDQRIESQARCSVLLMAQGADAHRCHVSRETLFIARTLIAFPVGGMATIIALVCFVSVIVLRVLAAAVRGLGIGAAARRGAELEERRRAREEALSFFAGNGIL